MGATPTGDVLYERETEIALLGDALDSALSGSGRAVLVEGSAGIGKTRLLDELCRTARGRATVLRARGGEQERDLSMLATRELFGGFMATASEEALERAFAGAAALAGPLLGRLGAPPATDDFALIHGLYWLTANLADQEPVVLVVDDAHWIDEPSQRWLSYLLPRLAELPVLLVLAVRPRVLEPTAPLAHGLAAVGDLAVLRPPALGEAASRAVLDSLLPGTDDGLAEAVHRATGGNPLLLVTLAKAVAEAGLPATADAVDQLEQLGAAGLGRILVPRLHGLGGDATSLARCVAVLGDGCRIGIAGSLAGLDGSPLAAALDRLVAADFVAVDEAGDGSVGFTHPLVRATVLDDVPPGTAGDLHARAAKLLAESGGDPERIALHLAATDLTSGEWVVDALRAAARAAASRGAPAAAVAHVAAALEHVSEPAPRCQLLVEGAAYAFACAEPRGIAWLAEARDLAADPVTAALVWAATVNWRLVLDSGSDPTAVLRGLPPYDALPPDLQLMVRSMFLFDIGFTGASLRRQVELRPEPSSYDEDSLAAHVHRCAQALDTAIRGRPATETLALGAKVNVELVLAAAGDTLSAAGLGTAVACAGDLDQAAAIAHQILEHATRAGSMVITEGAVGLSGAIQLVRGEIAQAEALLAGWLEEMPNFVTIISEASSIAELVAVHCERDRLTAAEETLRHWPEIAAAPPPTWHGAYYLHRRADLRRLQRQPGSGLEDDLTAGRFLADCDSDRCAVIPWRAGAAESLGALGRTDEALAMAREQLEIAREIGAAPLLGQSLRVLGVLTGGEAGHALLEESCAVLAASSARGEWIRTLLELGRSLRRARRPSEAREPLLRGLDEADRTGARLLARLLEEELRLVGARPRRRAMTGVQSLTPAELRVATLAADGLSNPEIAQSLFVTRKTVENHLGSAFAKLHISSRDQLPVVLGQP